MKNSQRKKDRATEKRQVEKAIASTGLQAKAADPRGMCAR